MDTLETIETTEDQTSFGTEIAKAFVLSAAASVGTLVGFIVIGAAVNKVQEVRKSREAKTTEKKD